MRLEESPKGRNLNAQLRKEFASESGTRLQSQPGHIAEEEEESPINEPEISRM